MRLAALLFLAGGMVRGQMSLDDFERMALAKHPALAQARAEVRAAEGRARQAGLYPNPTVGYYGDEIRGGYTGGGKQGGFVSQTIVTGGKLGAARRVARLAAGEAETQGEGQRLQVLTGVRMGFYEVLTGQRLVEVRDRLAKLAADAAQTAHQLANVGQADGPDVLEVEVEERQAVVALGTARVELSASWRRLAAAAGEPGLAQAVLAGDTDALPELLYEEWLERALRESPEMKLAGQAAERMEASLAVAKKAAIPNLQLYGNLSQNFEPLETTRRPIGLDGGVQIGVEVPLFNRNQGNIAAAKAEAEAGRGEAPRVRLRLARELADLFREYDSARAAARQIRDEMLPRARQAYTMYQTNYRKMAAAYPQALMAQRTLFRLEVDYVEALRSAWRSALAIRGFGSMDGLSK